MTDRLIEGETLTLGISFRDTGEMAVTTLGCAAFHVWPKVLQRLVDYLPPLPPPLPIPDNLGPFSESAEATAAPTHGFSPERCLFGYPDWPLVVESGFYFVRMCGEEMSKQLNRNWENIIFTSPADESLTVTAVPKPLDKTTRLEVQTVRTAYSVLHSYYRALGRAHYDHEGEILSWAKKVLEDSSGPLRELWMLRKCISHDGTSVISSLTGLKLPESLQMTPETYALLTKTLDLAMAAHWDGAMHVISQIAKEQINTDDYDNLGKCLDDFNVMINTVLSTRSQPSEKPTLVTPLRWSYNFRSFHRLDHLVNLKLHEGPSSWRKLPSILSKSLEQLEKDVTLEDLISPLKVNPFDQLQKAWMDLTMPEDKNLALSEDLLLEERQKASEIWDRYSYSWKRPWTCFESRMPIETLLFQERSKEDCELVSNEPLDLQTVVVQILGLPSNPFYWTPLKSYAPPNSPTSWRSPSPSDAGDIEGEPEDPAVPENNMVEQAGDNPTWEQEEEQSEEAEPPEGLIWEHTNGTLY
ncbi:hypothetical protein M231_03120 [Tremella mesenterica]|uniref:Uncharacterized protein n=1 Tax=Tremella mesenterica TaxID=5217 RepID=A0A4Q1BP19_TREME|nr:hypothetical protein M231_03120 [Tremella mesenterica]